MTQRSLAALPVLLCAVAAAFAARAAPDPAVQAWRQAHEKQILSDYFDFLALPNVATSVADVQRNGAVTSSAYAADQFDLICKGTATDEVTHQTTSGTERMSFDLINKRWCVRPYGKTFSIIEVTPKNLSLTDEMFEGLRIITKLDRSTNTFTVKETDRDGKLMNDGAAKCEFAPFTPIQQIPPTEPVH